MIYDHHIFVCTNQRPEGAKRPCCGEAHGQQIIDELKRQMKEKAVPGRYRVQKTGCMDLCEKGPMMAVYPKGTFYGNVQLHDVAPIVDALKEGRVLDRLEVKTL